MNVLPIPWVDELARKELDRITSSTTYPFDIFEWGCGGSTLWFALRKIGYVYSIEHNQQWYEKVKEEISNARLTNVSLIWIPPVSEKNCMHSRSMPNLNFDSYTHAIKMIGRSFDLIVVDGRARVMCFSNAVSYVKDGGYIVLHDSERKMYNDCRTIATAQGFTVNEIIEKRSTLICQKLSGSVQ